MVKEIQSSNEQALGAFFGSISGEYDVSIFRGCPPYLEMLEALIQYVFLKSEAPLNILELGCGTGNLSRILVEQFPQGELTVVDLSEEMLAQTKSKLQKLGRSVHTVANGFMEVTFPENHFDLVVSSLALHHVLDEDKPALYGQIFKWLKPGGKFRCADQCLALPAEQAHVLNFQRWEAWATQTGATAEELSMWKDHSSQYDHYASLGDHLLWLNQAGFAQVDCYWRKLFWTVFGAEKPLN